MPTLNRVELFHVLVDAFRKYSEATLYIDGANPYRFSLNGKYVSAFIGNIHHASRSDDDEYRIQCPGDLPTLFAERRNAGDMVVVLGYHPDWDVFSAWDPARFLARNPRSQRFSIYTRLSRVREATVVGASIYTDSDQQSILLFRSEFAGLYVENSTVIHQASDTGLRNITDNYRKTRLGERPVGLIRVKGQRITVTHSQYARSPQFRAEVLGAYSHKCAMCDIQLDLVEAAHVVPHAHPQGLDVIGNGLALCTLHHKSFDTGLLYVEEDYSIQVNTNRVNYLRKTNRAGGLGHYRRNLHLNLSLPSNIGLRPLKENIVLGNQLRGVGV